MRFLIAYFCLINQSGSEDVESKTYQWAIKIEGGEEAAIQVAIDLGLNYAGKVGTLDDYYILKGQPPASQQELGSASPIARRAAKKDFEQWSAEISAKLNDNQDVTFADFQVPLVRVKRVVIDDAAMDMPFNDPFWREAWHLNQKSAKFHMNVQAAWRAGYTGKGVVVAVVDDGLDHSHPDIAPNYDAAASVDVIDDDPDPSPRYDIANTNYHGTGCAGELAAVANNSICSVGVAFNAKIGGVRMLDGIVYDSTEAAALSFNPQHIDIYSNSWGPDDTGTGVSEMRHLLKKAILKGIQEGRGGKGSIYVFASGNGGLNGDSCSCDGYATSIHTITISSSTRRGTKPWYLEECPAVMATTYSSGSTFTEGRIVTTGLNHQCVYQQQGTSASTPIAAGMIALAIEANQNLTWRDVQHIIVETSRSEPLVDGNWFTNGVGRKVSSLYGYGLMDGYAMVRLAERWKTVPRQNTCVSSYYHQLKLQPYGSRETFSTLMDSCSSSNDKVRYVEHVQAVVKLIASARGNITLFLTSPAGTRSQLLTRRHLDTDRGAFINWAFMSLQFWGEQSEGTWTLEVNNLSTSDNFRGWQLKLFGTEFAPEFSTLNRNGTTLKNCTQVTGASGYMSTPALIPPSTLPRSAIPNIETLLLVFACGVVCLMVFTGIAVRCSKKSGAYCGKVNAFDTPSNPAMLSIAVIPVSARITPEVVK